MAVLSEVAVARVRRFCAQRIPPEARDEVRLEVEARGQTVTILEVRAPWQGTGPWTRMKIAQLRYDSTNRTWTLYSSDRNGRWHRYPGAPPAEQLDGLLDEIAADTTGIFWG
jgi:hypothetical protein